MEKLNKAKTPVVFYIGCILLCVWLISVYLIGGVYARYSTYASSEDSARVAIFKFEDDLSDQSQTLPTSFGPGEKITTSVTIKNEGEVTLRCVVKVENLTDNLPIEDQIIYSSNIGCNDESTFSWDIEWPKQKNSVDYMGKIDVLRLVVTVEQVD